MKSSCQLPTVIVALRNEKGSYNSKIIGALDVVGAQKVELQSPTADIVCADGEFIRVTAITATEAV